MDRRLSGRDLRILGLLYVHADKLGVCWPSRECLSTLSGLPPTRVSEVTGRLAKFGWLSKFGKGGRSMTCRYRLHIPETMNETVTVPPTKPLPETGRFNGKTITETVTPSSRTVTDSVTKTVTGTVTGIEQTSEQTKTPQPPRSRMNGKNVPLLSGSHPPDPEEVVSGGSALVFPSGLSRREVGSAEDILGAIPQIHRQAILDVLAANIESGSIRKSALACLGGLVRRYQAGTFDEAPGLHVAERRRKIQCTQEADAATSTDDVLRTHARMLGVSESDYLKRMGRH